MGTEKRERQKANRALKYEEQSKTERRDKTKRTFFKGGIIVAGAVIVVIAIALIGGAGGDDDGDEASDDGANPAATNDPASTDPNDSSPDNSTANSQAGTGSDFEFGTGECAPTEKPAEPKRNLDAPPKQCIDPAKDYQATLTTTEGDIVIDLDTEQSPGTVNNFVNISRWGYYDGTTIFRADQSIGILQGGGNSPSDQFGYTIPDEGAGYTYEPGQVVMARTSAPNSGGAQWFITVNDAVSALNDQGTYVVFGNITEGLDVAEKILAMPSSGEMSILDTPVKVESIEITER